MDASPAGLRSTSATDSGERLKVRGSMSAKMGRAPARRMAAGGGEEAERSGDNGVGSSTGAGAGGAVADAGRGEREPEGVGAAGAANGKGGIAGGRRCGLKCGDAGAEDEALRVADLGDGVENLLPQRAQTGGRNRALGRTVRRKWARKQWYNADRLRLLGTCLRPTVMACCAMNIHVKQRAESGHFSATVCYPT